VDIARSYDLENLENRGLKIVLARLGTFLEERPDFCRCEQCVFDLLAFTLNHVTPLYASSLLGPLAGNERLLDKISIEIEMALEDGARRIARNPGHVEEART
jgi:competence protein ComFB